MKVFTKIEEFLATKPAVKPAVPVTKPGTPTKPSPIRRDKPSVDPKPKAKAKDVVDRFMQELKTAKSDIKFDISKLKKRYED